MSATVHGATAPSVAHPAPNAAQGAQKASQTGDSSRDRTVPKHLHTVWVGTKPVDEEDLREMLEISRLAPSFKKTIWTNNPSLLDRADRQRNLQSHADFELAAAFRRARVEIRSIDDLTRNPICGLRKKEIGYLSSIIARNIDAPLANQAGASNVIRLLALHIHGGIYHDFDTTCDAAHDISKLLDVHSMTKLEKFQHTLKSFEKNENSRIFNIKRLQKYKSVRKEYHQEMLRGSLEDAPQMKRMHQRL